MMIDLSRACSMLGWEYEAALECMWDSNDFAEEVALATFLKAWTEYVAATTADAVKYGCDI
ncbi:MAG: hypothetical protein J6J78_08980 [Clostridia bacterium]|nr:hypothetical protein [Clostridia bacterium]